MFRLLKQCKPVPLGRWNTNKPSQATLRLIDLANCDSCGSCAVPEKKAEKAQYLHVEGDVIEIGYMPLLGSFELHRKP